MLNLHTPTLIPCDKWHLQSWAKQSCLERCAEINKDQDFLTGIPKVGQPWNPVAFDVPNLANSFRGETAQSRSWGALSERRKMFYSVREKDVDLFLGQRGNVWLQSCYLCLLSHIFYDSFTGFISFIGSEKLDGFNKAVEHEDYVDPPLDWNEHAQMKLFQDLGNVFFGRILKL